MNIIISNSSGQPIYDQITSQIKALIMAGELKEGDALPSMRFLAKELRISVITTKRAYDELEQDGFIYTVAGKGSFVAAKNTQLLREENLRKIEGYFQEVLRLAPSCGLTADDLAEMLRLLSEEGQ